MSKINDKLVSEEPSPPGAAETLFRALFEQSTLLLGVLDARGVVLEINDQALAVLGCERAQTVGRSFVDGPCVTTLDEAQCNRLRALLRQASESVKGSMVMTLQQPDAGRVRLLLQALPILLEDGLYISLSGAILSDSQAQKHSLAELTTELQASNAELEQFAYVVSHDLRQPLRMVTSYVQLLERRLSEQLDQETRQMMHFAVDGVRRMDQMLVSLLEYSRVGRMGEPMAPLDSRQALDEALTFLQPAIQECDAEIQVSGDWPHLLASRDEFTRLFQNLVGNALKYRDPARRPQISVAALAEEAGWRFVISDNGIGIDPDQIGRLFRVFQRLHPRDQYEGTGIGLAVARKIVERHGGRIWIESSGAGQGCRVIFTLPDGE